MTAQELKAKLARHDEIFLIDVREKFEHEEFNIGGMHVPLDEIMSNSENIPTDEQVVVYCHRGIRSQIAIQRLEERFGFNNLINLQGGLEKWEE
ncbi:MAG: rhodanese-like domain-containing protein [Bacteroidota bacterium]|nr:rhodanese-like domain-containing protein [Bacteroidota bacterium]